MTSLPIWIQLLQALLTPAVAIAVGVIAFMQWRTAHQKVVLDLFDRRLAIYTTVMAIQSEFVRQGDTLSSARVDEMHEVRRRARFLFGEEVSAELSRWHDLLIDLSVSAETIRNHGGRREEHGPKIAAAMKALLAMRGELNTIFVPYMRMDQKRIRTPAEWLSERNRRRLSYADEWQK